MTPREWDLYVEEKEREPDRLPDDHPDSWQWLYGQLSKAEREELLHQLLTEETEAEQGELF